MIKSTSSVDKVKAVSMSQRTRAIQLDWSRQRIVLRPLNDLIEYNMSFDFFVPLSTLCFSDSPVAITSADPKSKRGRISSRQREDRSSPDRLLPILTNDCFPPFLKLRRRVKGKRRGNWRTIAVSIIAKQSRQHLMSPKIHLNV